MNLVNELQVSVEQAADRASEGEAGGVEARRGRHQPVAQVRARRISNKGQVPTYRQVTAALVFKTMGYVPVGMGYVANGVIDYPGGIVTKRNIRDSIQLCK